MEMPTLERSLRIEGTEQPRWATEFRMVKDNFPGFDFRGDAGAGRVTAVEGTISMGRESYGLRIEIPESYPQTMPAVFPLGWTPEDVPGLNDDGTLNLMQPADWVSHYTIAYLLARSMQWIERLREWRTTGVWEGLEEDSGWDESTQALPPSAVDQEGSEEYESVLIKMNMRSYIIRNVLPAVSQLNRRAIMKLLESEALSTAVIEEKLEQRLTQSNIKSHLDVLISSGLVEPVGPGYGLTLFGKEANSFVAHVNDSWLNVFPTEDGSIWRMEILLKMESLGAMQFGLIVEKSSLNKSEAHRYLSSLQQANLVSKGQRLDPYQLTDEGIQFLVELDGLATRFVEIARGIILADHQDNKMGQYRLTPRRGLVRIDFEAGIFLEVRDGKVRIAGA